MGNRQTIVTYIIKKDGVAHVVKTGDMYVPIVKKSITKKGGANEENH